MTLFRAYRPPPPLSLFVDSLWFCSEDGLRHPRECVLPDGSAELVINLDDVPRRRFDSEDSEDFETVRRAWISGPQPAFTVIDVLPQATMMGVHFKPGGLAPFLSAPVSELCGELVELSSLWGRSADELRDALSEAVGIPAKFHRLERFLLRRCAGSLCPDPLVAASVEVFLRNADVPAVARLAEGAGLSHKHFIKRFRDAVGLSPKRFCRIARFRRALGDLRARREVDWADVAGAAGYYDRAHFIHDFHAFCGVTPGRYLQQPGADDRFVPLPD
jgi:AraC-like DNA-binding protein